MLLLPKYTECIHAKAEKTAVESYRRGLAFADLEKQRQLAETYNDSLRAQPDADQGMYDRIMDIEDGIMGILTIPTIGLELPIYHGVSDQVLEKGIGHMPWTALPIGGAGNHCVLTGHTGFPGAVLFTDLSELKEGYLFYIDVLKEELIYRIDQIKVVLPDDGSDLKAEPDKDYCTLVTCTPYGINSHRLLVRGERIENAASAQE